MNKQEVISYLKQYKDENATKYGIIALGFFGSVARGDTKETSDIDICIRTVSPNPFNLVHIKEELETAFHVHVDIVRVRDNMNSYLKEQIDQDGIYV